MQRTVTVCCCDVCQKEATGYSYSRAVYENGEVYGEYRLDFHLCEEHMIKFDELQFDDKTKFLLERYDQRDETTRDELLKTLKVELDDY